MDDDIAALRKTASYVCHTLCLLPVFIRRQHIIFGVADACGHYESCIKRFAECVGVRINRACLSSCFFRVSGRPPCVIHPCAVPSGNLLFSVSDKRCRVWQDRQTENKNSVNFLLGSFTLFFIICLSGFFLQPDPGFLRFFRALLYNRYILHRYRDSRRDD